MAQTSGSTGDAALDGALIYETRRIRNFFNVRPGVRILDDSGSPNAFAIPDALISGTHGTVLLGSTLIQSELMNHMGGLAVGGIVAHKCGHIVQFYSGIVNKLMQGETTARLVELHADYMAGFYFGVRSASKELDVKPFATSLFSKGDWAFNDPRHHGTPQERTKAMYAGFDFGKEYDSTVMQAAARGIRYVRSA
ncbi:MAG: hypothetical protein J0H14_22800 [Alphaproteobacteria bacterium]|nr:hypothetical protein [Alphaproteobacteria bacterium]